MRHQAQGFGQTVINSAYMKEHNSFCETVTQVARAHVRNGADVINNHTIYKVKVNDDHTLMLKARIAPHGNEDRLKNDLCTDCCMCPPTGIRIVLIMAAIMS